jgi:hypothetical protein
MTINLDENILANITNILNNYLNNHIVEDQENFDSLPHLHRLRREFNDSLLLMTRNRLHLYMNNNPQENHIGYQYLHYGSYNTTIGIFMVCKRINGILIYYRIDMYENQDPIVDTI